MRMFRGSSRSSVDGGSDDGSAASGGRGGSERGAATASGASSGSRSDRLMSKVARALLPNGSKRVSGQPPGGGERPGRDPHSPQAQAAYFNPEEHISEKRQWARRYTILQEQQGEAARRRGTTSDGAAATADGGGESLLLAPVEHLYEHFAVVGLSPHTNIRSVAADIRTTQRLAREAGGAAAATGLEVTADTPREERQRQYGLKGPAMQAQVLFSYPPPALPPDLAAALPSFCFPHGVRPSLLERTPSMSALNEVIYSQPYQTHDDHSFVFMMKVTDPAAAAPRTLFGVCCYVRELVHRPPSLAAEAFPGCTAPLSRYLVVAPRCYCLLTHHPFFSLHFRVLQTLLGLERLERMTSFATELAGGGGGAADADDSGGGGGGASWNDPPTTTTASNSNSQEASSSSQSQQPAPSADAAKAASSALNSTAAVGPRPAAAAVAAADGPAGRQLQNPQRHRPDDDGDDDDEVDSGSRRAAGGGSASTAAAAEAATLSAGSLAGTLQHLTLSDPRLAARGAEGGSERLDEAEQETEADIDVDAAGASTTPDQFSEAGSTAPAPRPTPYFTPAGASSALGTPASSRSAAADQRQAAAAANGVDGQGGEEGVDGALQRSSSLSIRRALELSMAVDGVAGGPTAAGAADDPIAAAMLEGGSGSAASSRPASRQQHLRGSTGGDDDTSSDAESYLTANSIMPPYQQQQQHQQQQEGAGPPEASPQPADGGAGSGGGGLAAARLAQQAQLARSVSGSSLAGFATGSPAPEAAAGVATEAAAAAAGGGSSSTAAAGVAAVSTVGAHCSTHSFVDSPTASMAAVAGGMAPRSDLLTATPLLSRSSRRMQLQHETVERCNAAAAATAAAAGAEGAAGGGAAEGAESMPPQQQQQEEQGEQAGAQPPPQQQQQQQQEVLRVTATNLDMSRPLRSADLLFVYRASLVPRPGQLFEFQPDPGLQTICFERPDLAQAVRELGLRHDASCLPDIDAAQNLGGWAVAALCRSMALENIITYLTAVLLERQVVVFCPNVGLLSGIVLSLVPLLLPFHWQSLLLPVLPAGEGRLELMEAPVPFVLGVMYKTPEVRSKCGSLVRVNVYKDKVKNAGSEGLPALPQQAALMEALAGTHAELRRIGQTRAAATRPVHCVSDAQQALGECFLSTLQAYLKGLVGDLRGYTITDVSPSLERTSVLLKDSFVDSFPPRDRPFMRQFAETQMFAVYTDAVIGP